MSARNESIVNNRTLSLPGGPSGGGGSGAGAALSATDGGAAGGTNEAGGGATVARGGATAGGGAAGVQLAARPAARTIEARWRRDMQAACIPPRAKGRTENRTTAAQRRSGPISSRPAFGPVC